MAQKRLRITKRMKTVIEIILQAGYDEIIELNNELEYRVSEEEVCNAIAYIEQKLKLN